MKIYWTYSKIDLCPSEVHKHEKSGYRVSTDKYHIGGLNRTPLFTHCITYDGYLHVLNYKEGEEVNIALIGGLNNDYEYKNTASSAQLLTLGNIVRFCLSKGENVEEGDFSNFNLEQWLKAINK